MNALIIQNLRHVFRSRLLIMFLVFACFLHYSGLKILQKLTMSIEGVIQVIGPREGIFLSLYFQLFIGVFLAAVYGIWMIPYLHSGQRSSLTFTLPVSKWKFPAAYGITFLLLILVEQVVMFSSFGAVIGWDIFQSPKFPWHGLLSCILLEILAFETTVFAFALGSLILGQIATFFLGMFSFFVMQGLGSFARLEMAEKLGANFKSLDTILKIYRILPPVGDIIFDLKEGFAKSFSNYNNFLLWCVWLGIFTVLFRLKLQYPSNSKSYEN